MERVEEIVDKDETVVSTISVQQIMHLYGKVIVIKRNGTDGAHFPLTAKCCVFGKGLDSDIRIQLPTVDTSQCQILIDDKEHVFIQSTTTTSSTLINDKVLSGALTALSHGDIITIVDRKFRFEFPDDSRFYPHKSPKSKSPRTPKRASMTKLSASEEKDSSFSRQSTPVAPLSPRTDNVPASVKSPQSPHSASKMSDQPAANEGQFTPLKTERKSHGSAKTASSPGLFSLPPSAFYRTSFTPGSSKDSSDPHEGREKGGVDVLSNIPSVGQKNPGSPYPKTPGNLRKSISDLRRRSVPVLETEEGSVQVLKKNQQPDFATPAVQVGNKRKSTGFDLLSAKRKRVSFGPNLSPEHFDKTLPPKTPIKKGATPNRMTKQERKSLLKAKSPGRKSISPRTKTPAKVASTPPSSQVFEVSASIPTFSPAVASADSAKLQSAKPGFHESESRRSSPRGASENEALSISSPRKESSPASKRNSQAFFKLNENDTSVIEILDQMLLSNAITSAVLSPNTKLSALVTDGSPLPTGNSSFASSQKSATPGSSSVSPTEKKRPVGRPRSQSSTSLQSSATSRSDSSFGKSVTPRRSSSVSPTEKKRSVGRPRSQSSTSLQSFATSGSDSSFRKSVTPRKSLSPHGKSASARASLSPKNTPLDASDRKPNKKYGKTPVSRNISLTEAANSFSKARKLSTSPALSQDLFSQVSPKASLEKTQLHNIIGIASPVGIKRIFRTPKHKQTANISPSAIKRLMKTPNVKHIQVSPISPIGLRNLVKTPRNKKSIQVVDTPSGLKRLFKTPHVKQVSESPRPEFSDDSFSEVSTLSSTLHISAQAATALSLNSGATPVSKQFSAFANMPGSPLSRRYSQTPQKFLGKSSSTEKKCSLGQPPLENNQPLGKPSSVERPSEKRPVGRPPSEKSPVGRSPSVESQTERLSPEKSPVGRPASGKSPVGRSPSEESPVGRPATEESPIGRPASGKSPVGRPPSEKSPMRQPATEKSPVGRPASGKSPVGRPASGKSPVGRSPSEESPVGRPATEESPIGRPASGKSPVGRPPSEKSPMRQPATEKSPVGRPASGKSPVGRPASGKSPVGRSPSEKSPVGRPATEESPIGRPASEKSPVGRPATEKSPMGRPPSEKRSVGRPATENSPMGRPPSEKRSVGQSPSVKSPVGWPATENSPVGLSPSVKSPAGRPRSEKRSVGRPPSEKRPVGRPPSEKRPVGQPPSEKRPVGRPPSEKRSVGRPPSEKKAFGMKNSPTGKIISPPQDFKKAVALRAIHGHGLTPKRATFKVLTPTSIKSKASNVFRKTPGKKTWSDVVKSGVQKPAPAKKIGLTTIKAVAKRISPKLIKKIHKTPKTPRALARALAPTTGHADSPATIIVGKKFKGTRTPKLLPRKGRKESLSKASRKSVGNTSFTGLAEMFTEPVVNESYLYADIPDTPDGPNEMFVSPLSNRKSSPSSRKSTNLTGVRELFIKKHIQDTNFTGVKELFITSKTASAVSPSGLKRLVKTPKKRSSGVSPIGVKRLLATPKIKGVPVSPVGLDLLFKTPTLSGDAVQSNKDSALKPSAKSGKTVASTKSGQRGRKRKSEEPIATPSSKKFKPTQLTADLSPSSSKQEKLKNKVASARKASPSKSPSPSRKRQSEVQKTPTGSPATVSSVASAAEPQIIQSVYQIVSPKLSVRGRKGKVAGNTTSSLVDGINVQSLPRVGVHDRKSQAQMMESTVNIERVEIAVAKKSILSPKAGSRGRRGQAAVKITPVQLPPKAGPRGRRGQAAVKITTPVQSPPKAGPRGRRGQAAVKLTTPVQSPPKAGPRGRRGQAPIKITTPVQSPPKVGPHGRRGKAAVKITTPVQSPPKAGPRGRRGQAAVKITTPVQSPPKAGARGKRGQAKELAVDVEKQILSPPKGGRRGQAVTKEPAADIETIKIAVAEKQILSPPKGGRKSKAQTQETVGLAVVEVHVQTPPKAGTRGRQAQAESKNSVVNIKTVNLSDADKQILSPAKAGTRGGRGKAKSKESTVAVSEESALSSTKGSGQGKTPQVQENFTLAIKTAEVFSKGRRGRGQTKEPVTSLNVDGVTAASKVRPSKTTVIKSTPAKDASAASKVRPSKTTVIKSTPAKDASVAVIERRRSPQKLWRGKSKITETASVEHPLDVKATTPGKNVRGRPVKGRIDTSLPSNDKESQPTTEDNTSTAKHGGKRGKVDSLVVPQVIKATATNSPKHTVGRRRNESSPVTKPALPEKSGRRGAKPSSPKKPVTAVSSVASSDVSQEAKPVGGVKRKAGKSTTVPSKKVKLDSPVPVSPVKPRGTRRGQVADTKSVNINLVSSPKGRGRPKNDVEVKEVASVLTNIASVIPKPSPKGRKGQLKKAAAGTVEIVASPFAGKRGRPKKDAAVQDGATLLLKSSPAKSRQGKLKKAPVVETVVSPAAKKQGGLKATLAVSGKRKGKSAGAISNAAKVSPKSTVATRRRRL